jgi:hypothetical protein
MRFVVTGAAGHVSKPLTEILLGRKHVRESEAKTLQDNDRKFCQEVCCALPSEVTPDKPLTLMAMLPLQATSVAGVWWERT